MKLVLVFNHIRDIRKYKFLNHEEIKENEGELNFEIDIVIEVEPALGIAAKSPQHVKRSATARTCSE